MDISLKSLGTLKETLWKPQGNLETSGKSDGNLREILWQSGGNLMESSWKSHGRNPVETS